MVAWYPRSSSSVELRSQPGWLMVRPTEPRGCMIPLGSVQHLGHGSPLKPLAVSFDLLFPMKKQGGCLSLIFLRACFPASSLLPSLCSQSSSHVFQFSRHICNIYQYIYIYHSLLGFRTSTHTTSTTALVHSTSSSRLGRTTFCRRIGTTTWWSEPGSQSLMGLFGKCHR